MYTNNPDEVPVSITPSGFFGNGPENIVEIENFMTEEELDILENFARNNNVWDVTETHYNENGTIIYESEYWKDRVASSYTLMQIDPNIHKTIRIMIKRLKPEVERFFNVTANATNPCVVRWLPGQLQMPHADKELHEGEDAGKPNDFPYYDLGSLFYLNEDYEGGELYFPNQNIEIKPKRGAAYFFPGDMNYIHGVKEIKSGIRYTCPLFWHISSHNHGDSNE